jgi:hypothetical protein
LDRDLGASLEDLAEPDEDDFDAPPADGFSSEPS